MPLRGQVRFNPFPWGRIARARRLSSVLLIAAGALILAWTHGRLGGPPRAEQQPGVAPSEQQAFSPSSSPPYTAKVAHVDDGDTIRLDDGRQVRYLGIDAPERGEPLFAEACTENRRLVGGREVDLSQGGPEKTDRYGRLLAIVEVRGQGNVNAALVRAGLASVYITGPKAIAEPVLSRLLEAQVGAISEQKGVWALRLTRAARPNEPLVSTRFRIHRASCGEIRSRSPPAVQSLETEFRLGKSLCRSCKPLD